MKRKELLAIAERFPTHDVQFSNGGEHFDIINPFGKDSISVYIENDSNTPYMVCFSFNHVHLETPDQVIAYVNDIISGNVFAIGFFKDGRQRIGGNLDAEDVCALSYDTLARFVHSFRDIKLIDVVDSLKVRGWMPDACFDAKFIMDEEGNVSVQRMNISL